MAASTTVQVYRSLTTMLALSDGVQYYAHYGDVAVPGFQVSQPAFLSVEWRSSRVSMVLGQWHSCTSPPRLAVLSPDHDNAARAARMCVCARTCVL